MTERIKEQLSAFLDGELPDPEAALLVKRLERDDDLRGALSRYSLIGAVLRNDGDAPAARQVAARVSAAIAREPAGSAAISALPGQAAWLRSLAGLAIAASVAASALLLIPQFASQDGAAAVPVLAQAKETPVEPLASASEPDESAAKTYTTPPAAAARDGLEPAELANFLVAHYGYASPLVRRSVVAGLISEPGAATAALVDPAVDGTSTEP